MPVERIGLRILYEALGASIQGQGQLLRVFDFPDGTRADVTIGPQVKYGFTVHKTSGYTVPDADGVVLMSRRVATPEEAGLGGRCFTDIIVSRSLEVSEEISQAFRENKPEAHNPIFQQLQPIERELRSQAEFIAGIMGLRFHRQLVLRWVCEEHFVFRGTDNPAVSCASPAIENLERVAFKPDGPHESIQLSKGKGLDLGIAALPWLIHAWQTHDSVSKFISLFIPLEVCLSGIEGEISQSLIDAVKRLNEIVEAIRSTTIAGIDHAELKRSVDLLAREVRPSLGSRFEAFAKEAKLPGWAQDLEAFKRFNKIRNGLFHRGDREVQLVFRPAAPEAGIDFEIESRHLEDLVERYVCFRLMGDARVYPSRWFPGRPYPT